MDEPTFRAPVDEDVTLAGQWLSEAGLPVEDLTIERLALVAEQNGEVAGVIGLERFAGLGLLRSLVVSAQHRRSGLGKALVGALEQMALEGDMAELWLLTIDADAWFARLGYEAQARELAPAEIRQTEEFSDLCPGDAVLMRKLLTA